METTILSDLIEIDIRQAVDKQCRECEFKVGFDECSAPRCDMIEELKTFKRKIEHLF